MSAILSKAAGELRRRRLQTVVLAVILLLASCTGTMALTLLSESGRAFDDAFASQKGAQLIIGYDARAVTPAQLEPAKAVLKPVATGGPWPNVGIRFVHGTDKFGLNLVGRTDPDGDVAVLRLVSGRWLQGPGEIVITKSLADSKGIALGESVTPTSVPDKTPLRVVGEVVDVEEAPTEVMTQSAWVVPSQIAPLVGNVDHLDYQVYYRFSSALTTADIDAARNRLQAVLPSGAIDYFVSSLMTRQLFTIVNSVVLATLFAFSVFALGAVVAIIANIVTGIVIANYRDIGIMKSIGFTPRQVTGVLVTQMMIPAFFGCLLGIPLGNVLSQPLLIRSASAMGIPSQLGVSPLLDLVALGGCLLLVAVAAAVPALRAGRLSAVTAIAMGTAPLTRRSSWLGRQIRRLPIPLSWSLGAGDAVIRPVRALLTVGAILVGVATMTFALGLHNTFSYLVHSAPQQNGMVIVNRSDAYPESKVLDTLQAQPETRSIVAADFVYLQIPHVADPVQSRAYRGDSSRLYTLVQGRWFSGPNEAVAPSALLADAHVRLGDTIHAKLQGHPVDLKIVGVDVDLESLGHQMLFDWSTLQQVDPTAQAYNYTVELRPGSDAQAYVQRVFNTEPDFLDVRVYVFPITAPAQVLDVVILFLTIMLAAIAAIGVFSTVLLNVRENVREMAVLKSLGLTPRGVISMVTASIFLLGVVAVMVGIPLGIFLHRVVLGATGSLIGNEFQPRAYDVLPLASLPVLALLGLVPGLLGSLAPARWAARAQVATILRAE
jgi:putative ABC transport system permease protein